MTAAAKAPIMNAVTLNLASLYGPRKRAVIAGWGSYLDAALKAVPPGVDVVLSGPAPVWLYLKLAHALHGRARALYYESPVTGPVEVFNHDPFDPGEER